MIFTESVLACVPFTSFMRTAISSAMHTAVYILGNGFKIASVN